MLPYSDIFKAKIKDTILPKMSDKRFIDSWRGTFMTKEFTKESQRKILDELDSLI